MKQNNTQIRAGESGSERILPILRQEGTHTIQRNPVAPDRLGGLAGSGEVSPLPCVLGVSRTQISATAWSLARVQPKETLSPPCLSS